MEGNTDGGRSSRRDRKLEADPEQSTSYTVSSSTPAWEQAGQRGGRGGVSGRRIDGLQLPKVEAGAGRVSAQGQAGVAAAGAAQGATQEDVEETKPTFLDNLVLQWNKKGSPFELRVVKYGELHLPVVAKVTSAEDAVKLIGPGESCVGYVSWTLLKKAGLAPRVNFEQDARLRTASQAYRSVFDTAEDTTFKYSWQGGQYGSHSFVHPVWAVAILLDHSTDTKNLLIQALAGSLEGDLNLAIQIINNYDIMNNTSSTVFINTTGGDGIMPEQPPQPSTSTSSSTPLLAEVAEPDLSCLDKYQPSYPGYQHILRDALSMSAHFVSVETGLSLEMAQCLIVEPMPESGVTPAQLAMLLAGLHIQHEQLMAEEMRGIQLEDRVEQLTAQLLEKGIELIEESDEGGLSLE